MGCSDPTIQPAAPGPTASEIETTIDSIDQWLSAAQPDKGELIARAAVAKHPSTAVFHAQLGRVLLIKSGAAIAEGDQARTMAIASESLAAFQRAFELGDTQATVIRAAGIAAEQAGELATAITWYRRGADILDEACVLYLVLALLQDDRPEEALDWLDGLYLPQRDDPFLNATRAECLSALLRHEEALAAINEALRLAPDDVGFRVRRAALLRRAGDPLTAAESLLAIPQPTRSSIAVTKELAAAFTALDRELDAADTWAAHARANPESIPAMVTTIESYTNSGAMNNAREWLGLLRLAAPNHEAIPRLEAAITEGADPRQVE